MSPKVFIRIDSDIYPELWVDCEGVLSMTVSQGRTLLRLRDGSTVATSETPSELLERIRLAVEPVEPVEPLPFENYVPGGQ